MFAQAGADLSLQVCASCSTLGFEPSFHSMPRYHRVFDPGHLQFITSSTYRRVPVLVSKCLKSLRDASACAAWRRREYEI
jgi:hypothetical protein